MWLQHVVFHHSDDDFPLATYVCKHECSALNKKDVIVFESSVGFVYPGDEVLGLTSSLPRFVVSVCSVEQRNTYIQLLSHSYLTTRYRTISAMSRFCRAHLNLKEKIMLKANLITRGDPSQASH